MLNIETLYLSSTLSRATILVIFGVMIISQSRARYLWHWCIALACSAVGTLINSTVNEDATTGHILPLLAMMLFAISLIGSWIGLRIFYERQANLYWYALSPVPSLLSFVGIKLGIPAKFVLPFLHLVAAVLATLSLYEILTSKVKRLLSQYVVAFAFAVYTLVLMLTAFMILAGKIGIENKESDLTVMVFDQVASILVYFGYLAMAGERAALELQIQAETDVLTGLINRRGGNRLIASLHAKSSANNQYSLIIADIDHFKKINDSYGHDSGDAVLNLVSGCLKNMMRKWDVAIRWGGEEFLILLPRTSAEDAMKLAERLRENVSRENFKVDSKELYVSLSLGVSTLRPTDVTFDTPLRRADQALYEAKQQGRNRTIIKS